MSEWKDTSLDKVLQFQRGFDITKKEQKAGSIPVVSSSGIASYHNEAKAKAPGVVIGRKGTLGTVHYISSDYWAHDTTLWVKDFKGNLPKFVYYFLKLMHLENYDTGASNPTLNRNHIHKIRLRFPPHSTQEKIAAVLSAYDDLIENNDRRIALLEEMAEEIYREWFVRLRFPGWESIEFHKGIPESWNSISLEKLTTVITKGTTPTTFGRPFVDEGINYIKIEAIDDSGKLNEDKFAKIDVQTHELLKRSQLHEGDILFSIAGAIGVVTIISREILPANTNQALAIIRSSDKIYNQYLYQTIKSKSFINFSLGRVVQTAQANVSLSVLSSAKILKPPDEVIYRFNEKISPIFNALSIIYKRNNILKRTRDRLLTRLISGKLSVEDLDIQFPPSMSEP